MTHAVNWLRGWLWWLVPFAALALLLGIETDWGRGWLRQPGPAPAIEPKPVAVALLPEYRVEGGLAAHGETVGRTLFNPTRRPAPALAAEAARVSMPKGRFVLTGTAVAGDRHLAFLKEVASGKSRVVRQGEQINGVMVAVVGADRVKFTQGDDSEELVLKVAVGPRVAPPAPPPQAQAQVPSMTNLPAGGNPLPGAVPPAATGAADAALLPARRPAPGTTVALPPTATMPAPAAAAVPAPGPTQTPAGASPDPAWNEVFERMRQRNRQ